MSSCVDVDPELWKVCSGNMVQVPKVDSKVIYFPQGHAEHANGIVDFSKYPLIPAMVDCRVVGVRFMAEVETDEVYLRLRLVPCRTNGAYLDLDENDRKVGQDGQESSNSFAKTLTQADANNGGGYSVPKYCAESLFPPLDYSADPPVQLLHVKDVHGNVWKFRHIFRGTPRRHLLTSGWSNFVNHKKLVAGDSVVFLRASNGELLIGTRRAKRGFRGGAKTQCGWTPAGGSWDSPDSRYSKLENGSVGVKVGCETRKMSGSGKVSIETVIETAMLAAAGKAFEVDYYPQAGSPEFCVKASTVMAAMRIQWCAGMKFKMPFETEDASKVSWFVGTVQAVQAADPSCWPNSPWRMLKVTWDEPNLLQNVERVSPWLVDTTVHSMTLPTMPVVQYSPPMKRLRLAQPSTDLPSSSQLPAPPTPLYPDLFIPNPSYYPVADNNAPASIQGARHVQLGQNPFNLPLINNPLNPRLFPEFKQPFAPPQPASVSMNFRTQLRNENLSSLLTLGKQHPQNPKENEETGVTGFVLFGKRIMIDEKMSRSSSAATTVSNMLSDGNVKKAENGTESSGSQSIQNGQKCCSSDSVSPRSNSSPSAEMEPLTSGCEAMEQIRCHL